MTKVLATLKEHQADLHTLGVLHASVFGSVARDQARPDSDVDVLIALDPAARLAFSNTPV